MDLLQHLHSFFEYLSSNEIDLYNEPGLQHELAIYLRENLHPDEIRLEYPKDLILSLPEGNPTSEHILARICKEAADIFLRIGAERYVIELKLPRRSNDGIPKQKVKAVQDAAFLQQLFDYQTSEKPIAACFAIFLSADDRFWRQYPTSASVVHQYFSSKWVRFEPLNQSVAQRFGNDHKLAEVPITRMYRTPWKDICIRGEKFRYYIIHIQQ
ncbi:MAG TPA: hypothetical protein P5550_03750 [Bacteroidales bacterium]|nr:hypothetical protein [Bacteroidales bacterium]